MWQDARKILCVRLDNLGDVLMTTPAFRALKRLAPQAALTLLTSSAGAGIAAFVPEIDAVISFDVPWVKTSGTPDSAALFALIDRLKAEAFDAAVIFTVFSQNPLPAALLCYAAGIPLRLSACRENPYHLLTDWLPDTEPFTAIQHEVTRQLALVAQIGAPVDGDERLSLRVPDEAAVLDCARIELARPWLLLHPGVSEAKRQYPPDQFAQAAHTLSDQGYQIVLTGVQDEADLCQSVAEACGGVSLAGRLSLGGLIALIAAAPLLIANNTGPVHIAAAVGTPVVVLYAHTNPQHTPWAVPNRVLYFDVPPALRSRSPLLRYTYAATVRQPVRGATPQDIVAAVAALERERQSR